MTDEIATRELKCEWCSKWIAPGEKIRTRKFMVYGDVATPATHPHCGHAMDAYYAFHNKVNHGLHIWWDEPTVPPKP